MSSCLGIRAFESRLAHIIILNMLPIKYKRDFGELTHEQLIEILERDWIQNDSRVFKDILREELSRAGLGNLEVRLYTPQKPSLSTIDFYGTVFRSGDSIVIMYSPDTTHTPFGNSRRRIRREIRHEIAHIKNNDLQERSGLTGSLKRILAEPRAIFYANLGYRFIRQPNIEQYS